MKIKLFLRLSSASLLAATFSVDAAVIDFESLEHVSPGVNNLDSPYLEAGYSFVDEVTPNNTFGVYGTLNTNFSGSTALFNRNTNGVTRLTRQDGTAFNLFSIDLAELNGDVTPPEQLQVTFTGLFSGGGTIEQTFTLDGNAFGAETFFFTDFSNLASVSWAQETPFHQFDNVVVNAVPVPAAVWLFGSGLLGLIGFARSRG